MCVWECAYDDDDGEGKSGDSSCCLLIYRVRKAFNSSGFDWFFSLAPSQTFLFFFFNNSSLADSPPVFLGCVRITNPRLPFMCTCSGAVRHTAGEGKWRLFLEKFRSGIFFFLPPLFSTSPFSSIAFLNLFFSSYTFPYDVYNKTPIYLIIIPSTNAFHPLEYWWKEIHLKSDHLLLFFLYSLLTFSVRALWKANLCLDSSSR